MSPELVKLAATLQQRCVLHLNGGRNGHTYGYEITDVGGNIVGRLSKHSLKGKVNFVYTIGAAEFETTEAFLSAYQQQIRDAEWTAAAPKEKTS